MFASRIAWGIRPAYVAHFIIASLSVLHGLNAQQPPADFKLDNGLQVFLRPSSKLDRTCLVVLYDIGNLNDPPEQSGMAHFAEHLYVTSATQGIPLRTASDFFRAYPDGANAQTGDRYTVIATVFPPHQLEDELVEAAARMRGLQVVDEDLKREIPRLKFELGNMFGAMPRLAVVNWGKQTIAPVPFGGTRGGDIQQQKSISRADLQEWLDLYYKPVNARLAVAGPFDPATISQQIRDLFGNIEAGEKPRRYDYAEVHAADRQSIVKKTYVAAAAPAATMISITFRVPLPADESYPAFLVLAARLSRKFASQITYQPIDAPGFLTVVDEIEEADSPEIKLDELTAKINELISQPLDENREPMIARFLHAQFLNLAPDNERLFASNPYGWAFMVVRNDQLDVDPKNIDQALKNLTAAELTVARKIFAEELAVKVVVQPQPQDGD